MSRSHATDLTQSGDETPPKTKEGGGSRRQRWSFAFRRRWFSTSARDLKGDNHSGLDSPTSPGVCDDAGILISPRKTKLGSSWHSDAPSSSCTDRPETGSASGVVKRKSLRRIFGSSNPSKDHQSPSSPTNRKRFSEGSQRAVLSSCNVEPSADPTTQVVGDVVTDNTATTATTTPPTATTTAVIDGVLSSETDSNCCPSVDEGLPPPMDEITLNNSHMVSPFRS
ncbi:hypothetical protein GCK32_017926 [Trichostrongylus colubriformis]|uniref:Uncharacterized protein n=1 Tax=Trichostrongylus colubriformis TaxID=6319 RepID=A0AAN8G175_TRICO